MNIAAARSPIIAAVIFACAFSQAVAKTREDSWTAYSRTAMAITGDIRLSPTRLSASGAHFPLKFVADVPDFQNDFDERIPARVLTVTRHMDPKLRNGNTLGCGRNEPIRWIVVWQYNHGNALAMYTFSGSQMPKSVKADGFCGSYFYSRK
jgi:hypothetical protein